MPFAKLRKKTGTIDRKWTRKWITRTRLARVFEYPPKPSRELTMTYLGLFCWFSGDGASCLNTVNEGKARRASLKIADINFYCSSSLLILFVVARKFICRKLCLRLGHSNDESWSIFIVFYLFTFQNNLENCPARDYFGNLDFQFLLYCFLFYNRLARCFLPRKIVHFSLSDRALHSWNAKCNVCYIIKRLTRRNKIHDYIGTIIPPSHADYESMSVRPAIYRLGTRKFTRDKKKIIWEPLR